MFWSNLKSVALPVPDIIVTGVLGGVTNPKYWRRDIAAFVLQHETFSHPNSSLLKIFQCCPGSRWMDFGLQRAKVLG